MTRVWELPRCCTIRAMTSGGAGGGAYSTVTRFPKRSSIRVAPILSWAAANHSPERVLDPAGQAQDGGREHVFVGPPVLGHEVAGIAVHVAVGLVLAPIRHLDDRTRVGGTGDRVADTPQVQVPAQASPRVVDEGPLAEVRVALVDLAVVGPWIRRLKPAFPGSSRSVKVRRRFPVMGSTCSNGNSLANSRFELNPLASKTGSAAGSVAAASRDAASKNGVLRHSAVVLFTVTGPARRPGRRRW